MTVHFQEHASNKRITWDDTKLVSFCKRAEWARFEHVHQVNSSLTILDLHPDMPLTRPYTSGGDSAYKGSRRALEVFLHESFLAVSQRSFSSSRCENLHQYVDGRDFRGRTTAFKFVNVMILFSMYAPPALGDMSTVGFFPSKHQSRRSDTLFISLPDRGGFFWRHDRHGLEPQHAIPFRFRKLSRMFLYSFLLTTSNALHVCCAA